MHYLVLILIRGVSEFIVPSVSKDSQDVKLSSKVTADHASTARPGRIIEFIIYHATVAPSFWQFIRFNV
ncbi:MAG: hypothetical protein CMJ81_22885 [Planctomycetaceae bacterium]|nr:hypothetical protein [Planctomycetaceae bacterium]MBP63486.1 hypothetical protein [Planctomycetaceae bacterium]